MEYQTTDPTKSRVDTNIFMSLFQLGLGHASFAVIAATTLFITLG